MPHMQTFLLALIGFRKKSYQGSRPYAHIGMLKSNLGSKKSVCCELGKQQDNVNVGSTTSIMLQSLT